MSWFLTKDARKYDRLHRNKKYITSGQVFEKETKKTQQL